MSGGFVHEPVMLAEVLDAFRPVPPGWLIDATVGGGGHAEALLDALPHHNLLGIDRDEHALHAAAATLGRFGERVRLRRTAFHGLADEVHALGDPDVAGVLFDLGVSSPQLDQPERGFTYRDDAPLDMRMDTSQPETAADVVNGYDQAELARLIRDYGDERYARSIAKGIVAARPLSTTGELVDVIRRSIPSRAKRAKGHPAKRTFQALRIEVNGELRFLPDAVDQAIDVLVPRGRCAVLAYHSGEDRIVKDRFRTAATGGCTCPPGLPCACGARPVVRLVKRNALHPAGTELAANPRARSARLRVVEKLPDPASAAESGNNDTGGDDAA